MKKLILGLAAFLTAGTLMAGSIDYLSNQSADYLRTFSRNASLDADAAVYNPAGTAFMTPGLTFALSNQTIFKLYENDLSIPGAGVPSNYNQNFKSTVPTYFLPNGQVVWNGGVWAAYLATGVVAGGGTAQYDSGIPLMPLSSSVVVSMAGGPINAAVWTGGNLTGTSLYPQVTVGGAYAILETLSVSAGLRYVYASNTYTGQATYDLYVGTSKVANTTVKVDVQQTAQGLGGIFGVDWKALQGLIVTGRFETATLAPLHDEGQQWQ